MLPDACCVPQPRQNSCLKPIHCVPHCSYSSISSQELAMSRGFQEERWDTWSQVYVSTSFYCSPPSVTYLLINTHVLQLTFHLIMVAIRGGAQTNGAMQRAWLKSQQACVYFLTTFPKPMLQSCGAGEDSCESLGLQGDQTSQS